MRIGLIPLDERPVNTRYPQMIAAIAGVELMLPPVKMLSELRRPADTLALGDWIRTHQRRFDALVVSLDMVGYGGLIASRITDMPLERVIDNLRAVRPGDTYAFNVITRIPNADYNLEEPMYWEKHGMKLHRYSQLIHRQQAGQPVEAEIAALRAQIPTDALRDFTRRRLRNHAVNLQIIEMHARDPFDLLVVSSDDTSEYGYGSQEKAWIKTWVQRFELTDDRLLMYPGADEVGCVLLMRAVRAKKPPLRFYVEYALPEDQERIAPYEDSPIRVTVERQIRAIGGVIAAAPEKADLIVAVNPPSRIGQEYDPEVPYFEEEYRRRGPALERFAAQIGAWIKDNRRVVVCDVAYPNGSDPQLIGHLLDGVDLTRLAAYGAWNTAGNTIGTALAQGAASLDANNDVRRKAQQRFLAHRFVEDWGYQHLVRQQIRDWLRLETPFPETTPTTLPEAYERIAVGLQAQLDRLPGFRDQWRVVAKSVRLPWRRTFEVDFELEERAL